jgi:hypothetical protein
MQLLEQVLIQFVPEQVWHPVSLTALSSAKPSLGVTP